MEVKQQDTEQPLGEKKKGKGQGDCTSFRNLPLLALDPV